MKLLLFKAPKRLSLSLIHYDLSRGGRGAAALATIIVISIFLLAVGFLIAIRGGTSVFTGQFESQAAKAQFVAEAGIQDALIKVARDKNASTTYSLSDTDWTVDIEIATGSPKIITATSTVTRGNAVVKRTIRANVTINNDGKITQVTKSNL